MATTNARRGPDVPHARRRVDVVRLDRERILRRWTRAEPARQAHVDPGILSDLVGGRRKSTFGSVQAVCTVLGPGLRDVTSLPTTSRTDGPLRVPNSGWPACLWPRLDDGPRGWENHF